MSSRFIELGRRYTGPSAPGIYATSRPLRCSRTCSRSSAISPWATSSGRAATATYSNHTEQVALQLGRTPFPFPKLNIKRRPVSIFEYEFEDFEIVDYQHHAAIKAPIAV